MKSGSVGRITWLGGLLASLGVAIAPSAAAAPAGTLSRANSTPFPSSTLITGANWTTGRYSPPSNQFGDILATSSLDSNSLYTLINDGGTDTAQPARWRNSFAKVTGSPGNLKFSGVGNAGPAKTYPQVNGDENQLGGPLGSYYANGFTIVSGVFYATQVNNYNWNANAPWKGLAGIAYSTDQGQQWHSPKKPFPGPTGNLSFVQYGDNAAAPDGYVYAIATEREFNASTLVLGRAHAKSSDITDPARWEWASAVHVKGEETKVAWTKSISNARPVLRWNDHITYPRMSYDAALHRYLLTFTYSYANAEPGVWRDGSQLVILESPSPAGPFSFVATQPYFGPSNGYDPAFPVNWMSGGGTNLWMIWAANFTGCANTLDCSGAYGFNYRQLHLTVAPTRRPGRHRERVYASDPQAGRPRWLDELPEPVDV